MKEISLFFDKVKNRNIQEIRKRAAVSKIIKDLIGEEIPIENISFKGKSINIISKPSIKSEIYIKKKLILKKISLAINTLDVVDIK